MLVQDIGLSLGEFSSFIFKRQSENPKYAISFYLTIEERLHMTKDDKTAG